MRATRLPTKLASQAKADQLVHAVLESAALGCRRSSHAAMLGASCSVRFSRCAPCLLRAGQASVDPDLEAALELAHAISASLSLDALGLQRPAWRWSG